MFATLSIYSGLTRIINFGVTSNVVIQTVGPTIAMLFAVAYLIAGVSMLFGIGLAKRNLEAFGLIVVASSVLIGIIATIYIVGVNPAIINGIFSSSLFLLACGIRAHSLFRSVRLESSWYPKIVANEDGDIVSSNQGITTLLGYKPEDLLGQPLTTIMPSRYRTKHLQKFFDGAQNGSYSMLGKELRVSALRADGTEVPVRLYLDSWVSGGKRFFSGQFFSIETAIEIIPEAAENK